MKTKMKSIVALALASGMASFASSAFGATAQVTINGHADYRAGNGGEFNVVAANAAGNTLVGNALSVSPGYFINNGTVVGTADGTRMNSGFGGQNGFETFCLEYNEHITLPGTYDATVSLGAIYGGVAGGIGGPPTTDLVSVGAAYLYERFARGTLAGYTYANGAGRAASAVLLQQAIWFLEDEISLSVAQIAANSFLQAAFLAHGTPGAGIGNLAGGAKSDNNAYNVGALNLGGLDPNQKQDQLILFDRGFGVPDGGTSIMLLGVGLSALALIRRNRIA